MIAPLRTGPERRSPALRKLVAARSMVAAMFLQPSEAPAPRIAAWKAWIFVAWIGLTLIVYALSMTGLIVKVTG